MTDILLAVRNGEAYLPALLESVLTQSESDIRLLCRDDGSADASRAVLSAAAAEDGRIAVIGGAPAGSAAGNFFALLRESRAEYAAFCDQDDVWHHDKLEKSLRAMHEAEERFGRDTPILVHTDLRVTDAAGHVTAESMMALQNLCPERDSLARLLCQSLVTGCTVLINAPLRRLCLSALPERCLMHDWWLSLLAAAFGHIVYLDEAAIDYRQHGDNAVGVKKVHSAEYVLNRLRRPAAVKKAVTDTYAQSAELLRLFGERMDAEPRALVAGYAGLPALGKLRRIRTAKKLGTLKCGVLRRAGQLLFL